MKPLVKALADLGTSAPDKENKSARSAGNVLPARKLTSKKTAL
jgi:hypothetical protein